MRHLPLFLPPFVASRASSTGSSSSTGRSGASPRCRTSSTSSGPRACWRWSLLVVDYLLVSPQLFGFYFFGKITIALYWLVQMFLLGGPRLAFRYLKYARSRHTLERRRRHADPAARPRLSDIEVVLRAIEAGTVRKIQPKGILSHRPRRSRPVDPRRAGARRFRRPRPGRAGFPRARRRDPAPRRDPERARARRREPDTLIARARRLGLPLVARHEPRRGHARRRARARSRSRICCCARRCEIDRAPARGASSAASASSSPAAAARSAPRSACARWRSGRATSSSSRAPSRPCTTSSRTRRSPTSDTRVDGVIADVRDRDARSARSCATLPPRRGVPRRRPEARALSREGLGRGREDERVRLRQRRRRRPSRPASGALVMISTDKAIEPVSMLGVDQALRRDVRPGARRRVHGPRRRDPPHRGAVRQRARLGRLGGAEVQGADRPGRAPSPSPIRTWCATS